MDPLSIAASVAGLLSLTVQVSQMTYNQVHGFSKAPKDAKFLLDELGALAQVLTSLEDFLKAQDMKGHTFQDTSTLVQAIRGLHSRMARLKLRLEKIITMNGFAKVIERGKWIFEHDEHQEILSALHRYLGVFQMSLNINGIGLLSKSINNVDREMREVKNTLLALSPNSGELQKLDTILELLPDISDVSKDVSEVTETLRRWDVKWRDHETLELITWLSPFNFLAKQREIFDAHVDGTGQHILDSTQFKEWLSSSGGSLWCPGIPGAGKTMTASIMMNYICTLFDTKPDTGVCCIYCNYKEESMQTPENLISSILRQLVLQQDTISEEVRNLYCSHRRESTRPKLQEISKILGSEVGRFSQIFVIIDALDECPEDTGTRDSLVQILSTILPKMNVMATSRFSDSIARSMERAFNGCARLEITPDRDDIGAYVKSEISRSQKLLRNIRNDETLQEDILKAIVKSAKEMFLLARLHMESLATKGTPKAVRKALELLPRGLDETYAKTMERIEKQNEDERQLANRILSWVCYAKMPLTMNELRHALAVEPNTSELDESNLPFEEDITSSCGGLITIDYESNTVRFIHYTADDYFQRTRENWFPKAQKYIATTCLTYLSSDAFTVGPYPYRESLDPLREKYPFLNYSAVFWGDHIRGYMDSSVRQLVFKFLGEPVKVTVTYQILEDYQYMIHESKVLRGLRHFLCYILRDVLRREYEMSSTVNGLWLAARLGLDEIVTTLLKRDFDAETKNGFGLTALYKAVENRHGGVVRLLLDNGADVSANDISTGKMALHVAAFNGDSQIAELLIHRGISISTKCHFGQTALHDAAVQGREAVARLLVEHGIDVLAQDNQGFTALHYAVQNGFVVIVQLLLEKAATDLQDKRYIAHDGRTLLQCAVEQNRVIIVQLLLQKGADVLAIALREGKKMTALDIAIAMRNEESIWLLLQYGAIRASDLGESHEAPASVNQVCR